jgi:hypothetical protein
LRRLFCISPRAIPSTRIPPEGTAPPADLGLAGIETEDIAVLKHKGVFLGDIHLLGQLGMPDKVAGTLRGEGQSIVASLC